MAIKISGNTIIDDSRNIVDANETTSSKITATNLLEAPRLTQGDIENLSDVKAGTIVYNTSNNEFSMFTGASWMNFVTSEGPASKTSILGWTQNIDTYSSANSGETPIHTSMRRCVLKSDGTVNYYLDGEDSTLKSDGSAADLSGADGNVMVEIPKFYFKYSRDGSAIEWQIANGPKDGFQIHPAFIKNGVEVNYRYIGAYDACYLDATDGVYKSGLNLDDMTANIDTSVDKLSSVSGIYPLVGVTRDEARKLAANNGTGWRQLDFWLASAIQLLYLVEYGDFNSQANLGDGNTNGSYLASSSAQNDSPHTISGASNSWGNASTDGTQPSAGAKPGIAYMSYRGIENFFGNCWNWVDGLNVLDYNAWVSNNDENFVDDTSSGMENIGIFSSTNGFITDIYDASGAFIPTSVGGSSSTYLTDYYFGNSGNRVALLGGSATNGALAGAFSWLVNASSGHANRALGARVCY